MAAEGDVRAGAKKQPADHGMVLATCMEVAPVKLKDTIDLADTTNYVFRGRVITLNKERTASLCFDTDLMRVAGAWAGPYVAYSAYKNMGPSVEGKMVFATRPGPGWDNGGKWDDPRPGKEGPLPRDWAHYRGLYLHGDRVILSYTVGEADVLEMPGVVERDTLNAVTRTFHVGPTTREHRLLVCEQLTGKPTPANAIGLPAGGRLETVGTRTHLVLPVLPKGGSFKLVVGPAAVNALDQRDVIEDLPALTKGGPPRWTAPLETTIVRGKDAQPYVVDDIVLANDNPWRANIRPAGLDFFPDGRMAVCTWDGDVWIVSGLDDPAGKVRWKRFAAGLQQPLGLKIVDGVIYTAGRDQVTRLHDLNGDGEADFYENFNNDAGLTLQRHEFVMDLQTDAEGNLYYCRSGHYILSKRGDNCCVYRLSSDGSKLEHFARGFREPNGLGIGPDGTMTVGDNEGNGIPQTPIYHLQAGKNYGFAPAKSGGPNKATWKYTERPIVWLPKQADRSAGGQVWVTGDRWGPLKGHPLHLSYGNSALYNLLIDKTAEPWQGAVVKFPLTFASGIMRARFSPADGQLYLCGLRGWDNNAARDGQLCRVRYTGRPATRPVGIRVAKNAIELTFSGPLDRAATEDEGNWAGDWSDPVPPPGRKVQTKKEEIPIEAVKLSPDRKTVTVVLERLAPVSNYRLQYQIKSAAGAPVNGELFGTIHRVPGD
jgi:hypothetical protein